MRDAPAIALQDAGVALRAYDPEGMDAAKAIMPADTVFARDAYDAATGADAVVIVTEWDAFRVLDFARLGEVMVAKVLVDLRNVYRCEAVEAAGFAYTAVGR